MKLANESIICFINNNLCPISLESILPTAIHYLIQVFKYLLLVGGWL